MQNDSADTRVRVRCDDDDDREPAGDCIDRISDEEFPVFMHVVAVQCQSSAKRYGRVTRAPQSRPLPIASRRAVDETLPAGELRESGLPHPTNVNSELPTPFLRDTSQRHVRVTHMSQHIGLVEALEL